MGSDTTLFQRLRQNAAQVHARLEDRLLAGAFFDDRDRYAQLLSRFYGVHSVVEPILAARPEWAGYSFDYERRKRLAALENDLALFGGNEHSRAALPRCGELPPLDDFASVLGLMYVLEGSTLGGTAIAAHVRKSLGLSPEPGGGAQFFGAYGARVGVMWREFGALVERYSLEGEHREDAAIAEAAKRTFEALEIWLLGAESAPVEEPETI